MGPESDLCAKSLSKQFTTGIKCHVMSQTFHKGSLETYSKLNFSILGLVDSSVVKQQNSCVFASAWVLNDFTHEIAQIRFCFQPVLLKAVTSSCVICSFHGDIV
jgi:hypothetical protein